ncbi:hypothetical protein CA54_11260 [Symmachiella macrocystis]|uniref:Cytochrome b561 bacterial/Ni-hydrogenase domain-containing protein n=1 Tax=Symmachiella macrocystis TaxID=2527985 RepID=A0A5C6BJH3_9PLAN|nr:hypothetical protein [Symmachiella macrocystis]TWU12303.1 hypothetical protein CA54_11260 [Symmachiella macrocystis]
MSRIFLSLVTVQTAVLGYAIYRGWNIGDATEMAAQDAVSFHMKFGLFAILLCCFCHALLLTYFMGTGRWLEETCTAYELGPEFRERNMKLKWSAYPAMTVCFALLIGMMITGVAADPASMVKFDGWGSLDAAQVHLWVVILTVSINLAVNVGEFVAIRGNGELVNAVLDRVREIRTERGLEV